MIAGLAGLPLWFLFAVLCGSGELEFEPWLRRRIPAVLPGLGRDGLLTMLRSTYLTSGTWHGELFSAGDGELFETEALEPTWFPSAGLGETSELLDAGPRLFPPLFALLLAGGAGPFVAGDAATVSSVLDDWAKSCASVILGDAGGRSISTAGLAGTAVTAVGPLLAPFANRAAVPTTGFFRRGFGGLKPVTAATGCRTAPAVPAGRCATWKMLTDGVESSVTGSGRLVPDGALVISMLVVLEKTGGSSPFGVAELPVVLFASSCCWSVCCSCRMSAFPLFDSVVAVAVPAALTDSPLAVAT